MGIAIPSSISSCVQTNTTTTGSNSVFIIKPSSVDSTSNSMSDNYHPHQQGIFTFPTNGFERATNHGEEEEEEEQPHHHQIPRDNKLVFEPQALPNFLVAGLDPGAAAAAADVPNASVVYETAGMLSEMFNFGIGGRRGNELLDQDYRGGGDDQGLGNLGGLEHHRHHEDQVTVAAHESAAAMQLFLTNRRPQQRSTSPPKSHHAVSGSSNPAAAAALHLLLPNQSAQEGLAFHQMNQNPSQFTWLDHEGSSGGGEGSGGGRIMVAEGHGHGHGQGQGLCLSLSTSLQHLDATNLKAEQMRTGGGGGAGMMFEASTSSNSSSFKDFGVVGHHPDAHQQSEYMMHHHHLQGGLISHPHHHHPVHIGFSASPSSLVAVNVLRHSKYTRATRELLEEFCSIGRGYVNKGKTMARNNSGSGDDDRSPSNSAAKDIVPALSPADKMEHQRRKVKLLSMLDELERRYAHYCDQMQMVVNSFDLVMGFGGATPYTALAQKAMSRHFRCLKDAIHAQLKHSCQLLGEKELTGVLLSGGLTKGETPRLKMLEQSLRQQRAFHHQMGLMDQAEAWRPQRGLPERSVNILRAWLFEHFLHPYPSDADKLLLARQTGLSRNQVSNWFINARVRLWKPMVEDMYQREAKEREEEEDERGRRSGGESSRETANEDIDNIIAQTSSLMGVSSSIAADAPATRGNLLTHEGTDVAPNPFFLPSDGHYTSTFSEDQAAVRLGDEEGPSINAGEGYIQTVAGQVATCDDYGTSGGTAVTVVVGQEHRQQGGVARNAAAAAHRNHHYHRERTVGNMSGGRLIRFGTHHGDPSAAAGDVSLTLGLHHGAGDGSSAQDKSVAFDFSKDFPGT